MLEQLKYQNHLGDVINFGEGGVFVNTSALYDYEWSATTRGNRIVAFTRSATQRTLPIVIMCDTEDNGIAKRNELFETFEKDVLAARHGKIIVGDYYFRCFVTKSKKSDYQKNKRRMSLNLTLLTDFPYWVKEIHSPEYSKSLTTATLTNPSLAASNFKIIIQGACTNPSISIAGHSYTVNCSVGDGERLTIDSTMKQISTAKSDGTFVSNNFNDRDKSSYIFEKIPTGDNTIIAPGEFCFQIILLDERSEPVWT